MTVDQTTHRPAPCAPSAAETRPFRVALGLEGLALGGCPINALDLARALRLRGHHIDVFAIDEPVQDSILPYAERAGFAVTVLPAQAGTWQRARQIRSFADRHRSDLVHVYAPWLGPPASIAAASRPDRATVVTNWTMDNSVRTASHTPLVVGTRRLQVEAQEGHRAQVWLMEPPVDLASDRPSPELARSFRDKWGIEDDELVAVVVSRLHRVMKAEGIDYAIRAVERLAHQRVRLVVVGDGNAYADLRALAGQVNGRLGRPAVVLTGSLLDPRPAYAAADLVLGMGGSALRAMAHAKPLVVLGERGFARPFTPETADYFYDAGFFGDGCAADPVEHLSAQIQAMSDPATRHRLGEFGLTEVQRRFGLAVAADTLERVYRAALDSPPSLVARLTDAAELLARSGAQHALLPLRRRLSRRAL